ncbi:hypothetical protein [uncultured Psychrobacter sp.]|uniref:hypothetical protein n=1 Tax=uncultured Psychrobacter sp. TaxID=259303 RepID=UPI00261BFE2B|nr:hypothetical protein [uncultured Psychrobacter sp.]
MKSLIFLVLLSLTACQSVNVDDDTIEVSKADWSAMGNSTPYPFTTDSGHIACSMNEVYYFPDDTVNDESNNGLPLNKLAQTRSQQSGIAPNVQNAIIPDAELSEAIRMGLDHCEKVKEQVAAFNSYIGVIRTM